MRLALDGNVQARIVDLVVGDTRDHGDVFHLQAGAMDPAGGLAQAFAHLAALALQQVHLARARMRLRAAGRQAACRRYRHVYTPLFHEGGGIQRGRLAFVCQVFGHVKTDTTRTDDRHAAANLFAKLEHVQVAEHFRVVDPLNRWLARRDTSSQYHLVKRCQVCCRHAGVQLQRYAGQLDTAGKVAQRFVELFFARYFLGHIELAADLATGIEQRHVVAAFGSDGGKCQARRAGAHHGQFLRRVGLHVVQLGFAAGTRVHQTAGELALEDMVQAGLVTADTGVDFVGTALLGLDDEFRVGQERARHGHHIGAATGQDVFGHFRRIDTVGGDQRNTYLAHQALGDPGKTAARYAGGNSRHAGFVPADTGIDDVGAGFFHLCGQLFYLVPGAAVIHQVQHGQAVNDDEFAAYGLAHGTQYRQREADAVLEAAAPAVGTLVGMQGDELVQQIAFRTHDLYPVVAGVLRQLGAAGKVGDGALDVVFGHFTRAVEVDRRTDRRGRHQVFLKTVAAGVQNLHGDLAACGVHGVGHDAVMRHLGSICQHGSALGHTAFFVGADPAGDDQAYPAARALGVESRHFLEALRGLFQAGVHGPHQHAVFQRGKAQVQRCQQVRVSRHDVHPRVGWCGSSVGHHSAVFVIGGAA